METLAIEEKLDDVAICIKYYLKEDSIHAFNRKKHHSKSL
jgi:hypothetical protein